MRQNSIREFLEANDQIYFDLFWHFFLKNWTAETPYHQIWWRFKELTVHTRPSNTFPSSLLNAMAQEEDIGKKQTLYELACILVMNGGPEYSSVSHR